MGWGKGKGCGPVIEVFPGRPHHHHHHHRHGPGFGVVAAEAALVGAAAGACVAATVARPRAKPKPRPAPVVIIQSSPAPQPAVVFQQPQVVHQPHALPPQQVVVVGGAAVPRKGKGKGKGKPAVIVAAPEPPLGVSSVRLQPQLVEQRGSVAFFGIDITPDDGGSTWRVFRRYNDFYALHNNLGARAQSYPDAPFPRKHMFGCAGQKLEDRRRGLECWLQRCVETPGVTAQWTRYVRDFLETGRQFIAPGMGAAAYHAQPTAVYQAAAPAQAAVAVPPPVQPPSNAPGAGRAAYASAPVEASPEPATPSDTDDTTLEITVPAGVSAGQILGVTVPDGKQINWTIPEGVLAGSSVELFYDATHGTLTRLT
eukprot:TRINITY_DN3074_c0_g2_i2.p1 TRINITY_DN3074_c0_g2~~TRINITY_DN3074_c0_g2_i2.p1  ORF type:complete len:369 (+),score=60.77 TRINITY_DN3074_c0_g2_i2:96-1202(+)